MRGTLLLLGSQACCRNTPCAGLKTQETNLELGFPANVVHVITPDSPLYNLSLLEMDTRMMEVSAAQMHARVQTLTQVFCRRLLLQAAGQAAWRRVGGATQQ